MDACTTICITKNNSNHKNRPEDNKIINKISYVFKSLDLISYVGWSFKNRWSRDKLTFSLESWLLTSDVVVDCANEPLFIESSCADFTCFRLELIGFALNINERCCCCCCWANNVANDDNAGVGDDERFKFDVERDGKWYKRFDNDDDLEEAEAVVIVGDTWRWRNFSRICCKRKKQSVHISIGSVHHFVVLNCLWVLVGVEHRRPPILSLSVWWLDVSCAVGVTGDLKLI